MMEIERGYISNMMALSHATVEEVCEGQASGWAGEMTIGLWWVEDGGVGGDMSEAALRS